MVLDRDLGVSRGHQSDDEDEDEDDEEEVKDDNEEAKEWGDDNNQIIKCHTFSELQANLNDNVE